MTYIVSNWAFNHKMSRTQCMRRRDSLERCIHDVVREEEHNALFAEIFLVLLQTKASQVGVRGESDALRHGGCSVKEGRNTERFKQQCVKYREN